jgi:hypothetical protein
MYETKSLDGFFFRPIRVPYKKIYHLASEAGLKQITPFGPILESGKLFGFGWIGVEVEKPTDQQRQDVIHIKGDFQMFEHRGPFSTLGLTYKKIMKECPSKKEYLNLYLDDPDKVSPENLRTQILFK